MENYELKLYTPFDQPSFNFTQKIVKFISEHSTEFNNKQSKIRISIDYAMKDIATSLGGYIITLCHKGEMIGVSILNKSGLSGIMSEYILSHMAIHQKYSKMNEFQDMLLKKTLEICKGDVTFLIKANNPMIDTCVDRGFEYQRLEMVYLKSNEEQDTHTELKSQQAM